MTTTKTVNSTNALSVAEEALAAIGHAAHFTAIGAKVITLGYVLDGAIKGNVDIATYVRKAMWRDTEGDTKAAASKFARCANRVYRLKVHAEVADSKEVARTGRKATTPTTDQAQVAIAAPGAAGCAHTVTTDNVAKLVAIALNKPIQGESDSALEAAADEANAAAQQAALADMPKDESPEPTAVAIALTKAQRKALAAQNAAAPATA